MATTEHADVEILGKRSLKRDHRALRDHQRENDRRIFEADVRAGRYDKPGKPLICPEILRVPPPNAKPIPPIPPWDGVKNSQLKPNP